MGLNTIGATGTGLPSPQALYPITINNSPQLSATNRITLPPGGTMLLPPGTWGISLGLYCVLQELDPVTQTWGPFDTTGRNNAQTYISSDGVNFRLHNPLGVPNGAIITNGGTGFTSAPTVAAGAGGSTWTAVVGGSIGRLNTTAVLSSAGLSSISGGSGAGYSVPPLINIAAPPAPGIPATAVATISGGALATFVIVNPGAGYTSVPAVTVVPQPSDLNQINSVAGFRNAGVTAALSGVGQVTGLFLTNPGNNPNNVAPALTFTGGGGSSAAATVILSTTVVNYAVGTAGSGYGSLGGVAVMTAGGNLATQTSGAGGQTNNPSVSSNLIVPRQAQIDAGISGGAVILVSNASSGIQDGGLYTAVPTAFVFPGPAGNTSGSSVSAAITPTMGYVNDTVFITPL